MSSLITNRCQIWSRIQWNRRHFLKIGSFSFLASICLNFYDWFWMSESLNNIESTIWTTWSTRNSNDWIFYFIWENYSKTKKLASRIVECYAITEAQRTNEVHVIDFNHSKAFVIFNEWLIENKEKIIEIEAKELFIEIQKEQIMYNILFLFQ